MIYPQPKLRTLNVNRKIKENDQEVDIPQKLTDADYVALLANTPAQTESLLHSLEQSVGLCVNPNKTVRFFKQKGAIFILKPRKFMDQFTSAQSAWAVEYTDCISVEEYDSAPFNGEASVLQL